MLDPAISGRPAEPSLFGDLFGDLFDDVPLSNVAEALRTKGEATAKELAELTGLSRNAVLNRLRPLTETGSVQAVGAARSPNRRYRWAEPHRSHVDFSAALTSPTGERDLPPYARIEIYQMFDTVRGNRGFTPNPFGAPGTPQHSRTA